ncbi:DUF2971 domain-containing protein, partial [Priestia megaterium]|nr:DUF2971 domain-containing protein [Priestia megaterium]
MKTNDLTWIDDYVKMMFPVNYKEINLEGAIALKHENIPLSLYKYRSVSKYSLENLEESSLWINSADQMNDPYDSSLTINHQSYTDYMIKRFIITYLKDVEFQTDVSKYEEIESKSFNEIYNYLSHDNNGKELAELIPILQKRAQKFARDSKLTESMMERYQKAIFISCFSERNDSMLMWSHYTNNHKGFCLEYNFKRHEIDPFLSEILYPVLYSEEMLDTTKHLIQLYQNRENHNVYSFIHSTIVKSIEWSYEKEWRLATIFTDRNHGFNMPFFQPEAIYLGAKISNDDKQKLLDIATLKNIDVYQMKLKDDEFKLIPQPEFIVSEERDK